ncbi:MAG: energy-coupling factor transporter transmembrane component T [Actinomycetaceae bacterium]|nr:energy-coupling factor transporter transmembrane component T [Actinomycetaceae bacterium]
MKVHPLAVIAMPLVYWLFVLRTQLVGAHIVVIVGVLLIVLIKRPRVAVKLVAFGAVLIPLMWVGYVLWLPEPAGDPIIWGSASGWHITRGVALFGLAGALRVYAMGLLVVPPLVFVDWIIVVDTLIKHFRVPYRILDIGIFANRYVARMQRDFRAARHLTRLRTRRGTNPIVAFHSVIPVLTASLRHGEQLSNALDARGFDSAPRRTVHHAQPVRIVDVVVLLAVWSLLFALISFVNYLHVI